MFKCVELHNNELLIILIFGFLVPPLPEWIEMLYLSDNQLDSVQVPESCKELGLISITLQNFHKYLMELP